MAVRTIRLWPDPVLSKVCARIDISDPTLPELVQDLFDTMYAANGRGLAAPQIGVLHRVFVVDVTWKEGARDPRVFINPEPTIADIDLIIGDEQCLSIPNLPMSVSRPDSIELLWVDIDGIAQSARFAGDLSRCIQHEFDHLDGTVIFDHQPASDRAELEASYAP